MATVEASVDGGKPNLSTISQGFRPGVRRSRPPGLNLR